MSLQIVQPMLILNKQEKGYLSVATDYDRERHRIHIVSDALSKINITAGIPFVGISFPFVGLENAKWNLQLDESTGQHQIINVRLDEPLYAGADDLAYDSERRRVFTWKPESYDYGLWRYWTLQECHDKHYLIKNVQYNEYLSLRRGLPVKGRFYVEEAEPR